MPTLFLSCPNGKTQPGSTFWRDFYDVLARRVGHDYAIYPNLIAQVYSGMKVVLFDRDRELQAEGTVFSCTPTYKAENQVQRYDVQIRDLTQVPYTNPPKVNHCGVAIN